MRELEIRFLEEYKAADRVCSDMLQEPNGLSTYLREMESDSRGGCFVIGWDNDFRMLKRLRWLRNQIVHEAGCSDCTEEDYSDLLAFHDRLLRWDDPLSRKSRIEQSGTSNTRADTSCRTVNQSAGTRPNKVRTAFEGRTEKKKTHPLVTALIVIALIILIVLTCLLIFK